MADTNPQSQPAATSSASGTVSSDGGAKQAASNSPVPTGGPASAPAARDAANEARSGKPIQRPGVITNPAPVVDPDVPVKEPVPNVPQSTIDEMAAGKKALERNRPVATKMEEARAAKEAGVSTTPETNPVDATHTLQQQHKV